jgi:hypothetical protein
MRIYHWLVLLYVVVSVLALAVIPLSAAGWITPDPLSAIPAMLLGIPWSYGLVALGGSQSSVVNFVLLALAMATNAALLWLLGHFVSRRWRR